MIESQNAQGTGLNIKAVSERTGVPLHTLRAWERRYGIPRPDRNAQNHYRLYAEQDIADVMWMKRQVEAGVSPARASALLRQQTREPLDPSAGGSVVPVAALSNALYDAFVERDDAAAQRALNEAMSALAPEQVVLNIIQPTMRRIGDSWQRNLLSVEQEHFASNLVRQRLHALLQAQPTPAPTAPRLVAACAPEEQHDLGLLIFTWLARRHGWNVNYLGQRTPLAELYQAGAGVRYIVITVTTVTGLASLAPIWNQPALPAPLLFGGEVFNSTPLLREHIPGSFLAQDGMQAIQDLATTTPRPGEWKPSRRVLQAALDLDAARFQVASETVRQFMQNVPRMKPTLRAEFQHGMNYATLFLTDAFVSALAFDAPEIIDLQGAWANEFMPSHEISAASLHHLLELYRAASRHVLADEAAKLLNELITRLVSSIDLAAWREPQEVM